MTSLILGALAPYATKFAVKNAGKLIGSGVKWMKGSKHEWLNKIGEKAGNVVNKINSWSVENKLDKTDIGKQIANASDVLADKEVKWQGFNNEKPKTDAVAVVQPNTPYVPYNKNLGGTNFQRYRKKKFKRIKVNPKFAVKGHHR